MKYIVLIIGITIANVTNFEVTNNDTTHIQTYYNNGNIESKGVKVYNIKEGEWTTVGPGEYHQFEAVLDGEALELYWAEFDHDDIDRETVGEK